MKKVTGLWTALVTPFKAGNGIDNEIDYEALERLLDMQLDAGVDGVLFLGTTAENPTLTTQEGKEIVEFGINKLSGKAKIMVNIGTYSTKESLETLDLFEELDGIDSYLVVSPYYNKPTQTGLFQHFTAIADATSRDIVLYNIEGRTGVNLETQTLLQMLEYSQNIVGIKEASGNLEQIKQAIEKTPNDFSVLSGDDCLTHELIKAGGDGVISVTSNCLPAQMKRLVDLSLEQSSEAAILNTELQDFFTQLFIQTNPLPVKTYLASKGIIQEEFRLPMCRMDEGKRRSFLNYVEKGKI